MRPGNLRKYCSGKCTVAAKMSRPAADKAAAVKASKRPGKVCDACGGTFHQAGTVSSHQWRQRRYCSHPCSVVGRSGSPEIREKVAAGDIAAEVLAWANRGDDPTKISKRIGLTRDAVVDLLNKTRGLGAASSGASTIPSGCSEYSAPQGCQWIDAAGTCGQPVARRQNGTRTSWCAGHQSRAVVPTWPSDPARVQPMWGDWSNG